MPASVMLQSRQYYRAYLERRNGVVEPRWEKCHIGVRKAVLLLNAWHIPTQNFLGHFGTCHVTVWSWYIPSIYLVYTWYILWPYRNVTGTEMSEKVLGRYMSGIYCISSYKRFIHVLYQVYTWYMLFIDSLYQVYAWYTSIAYSCSHWTSHFSMMSYTRYIFSTLFKSGIYHFSEWHITFAFGEYNIFKRGIWHF